MDALMDFFLPIPLVVSRITRAPVQHHPSCPKRCLRACRQMCNRRLAIYQIETNTNMYVCHIWYSSFTLGISKWPPKQSPLVSHHHGQSKSTSSEGDNHLTAVVLLSTNSTTAPVAAALHHSTSNGGGTDSSASPAVSENVDSGIGSAESSSTYSANSLTSDSLAASVAIDSRRQPVVLLNRPIKCIQHPSIPICKRLRSNSDSFYDLAHSTSQMLVTRKNMSPLPAAAAAAATIARHAPTTVVNGGETDGASAVATPVPFVVTQSNAAQSDEPQPVIKRRPGRPPRSQTQTIAAAVRRPPVTKRRSKPVSSSESYLE